MATLRSNLNGSYLPDDFAPLIDTVVDAKSVLFQVATVVNTDNQSVRVPLWVADPSVGFVAEGATIGLTDPTVSELVITPKKIAARTQISNEAAIESPWV